MENWRFIKENNDYMVSDHGRIMSLKKPQKKILSSSLLHNGYEAIYIYQKGIHAARYVHRLVAETFIPNPKKLPQVNHLDGNTLNNHVSNLEWCDAYDNLMHAIRTGLRPVNVPRSIPCLICPFLPTAPPSATPSPGNITGSCPPKRPPRWGSATGASEGRKAFT